jgi:OPA family sugar phosphate sensor protein UhpC-like MFS transporter
MGSGWIAALGDVLWRSVQPPTPVPPVEDPKEVARLYRIWRARVLYSTFIGYAAYYFTRKNLPGATAAMAAELHLSNTQLGLLGTLLYLTYGAGKFVNGVLGDHLNPRLLLAAGLLLSAACNVLFGMSTAFTALCIWWALNGWFQSLGFPPCARLLANWFSTSERGSTWGLWNISHQVGGMGIAALTGFFLRIGGWRACFFLPALLCAAVSLLMWNRLRDTPRAMGLPSVGSFRNDPFLEADGRPLSDEPEGIREILVRRVLRNPLVWILSVMNLFVYVVRSGAFDWAPKYLIEVKHASAQTAGLITSGFELLGIPGSLLAGLMSDRIFRGRRAPVCILFLLLTAAGLLLFFLVPPGHPWLDASALSMVGFAIYGPQFLVGVLATDLASPKAAATAIGLTGLFGYAGSALSGVGVGHLIDRFGWRGGFACFIAASLLGALLTVPLLHLRQPGPAAPPR